MDEIKWNDRFNIGVEVVDKAHKRLFSIVSKLISLNEDETKQQHACKEGIKYFKSYTMKHFAEEEAYMKSIDYEGYEIHKSLHDDMCYHTIPALEHELESQQYSSESIQHFLGLCVGWLNGHIMIEDHAITGRTSKKWVHQPAENEKESLKKAVIQTLRDLFRLKSEIVTSHYSGERYSTGNPLCYRLAYRANNGKHAYVYLVYEEQMVRNLIYDILGKQIKIIDKTVVYAMKALSQKFMSCMEEHFELIEEYQLEKINTLSFDQFARIFDRNYPPYSMLFTTEKNNYFVICINKEGS
ncbi:MAG: hemerythrin domain-containing protein [Lachnospiraceae bacterium]|nr:hemerythrin domain-containing protein [Lachnospiraceae bacterium]